MRSTAAYAYGRDRTLPAPREISLDRHKKHTQQTGTQRRFMHFPAANTGGVLQRLARRALLTTRTRATTLPPRRTRRRHNRPTRQAKAAEQISPALNDENAPNGAQKGFLKAANAPAPHKTPPDALPSLQTLPRRIRAGFTGRTRPLPLETPEQSPPRPVRHFADTNNPCRLTGVELLIILHLLWR